jgi:pSer/pThr/pTyr-binding forkhead associated (FHA) protein
MRARLFCRTGEMVGSTYEFSDDVVIGRGGANDIVLHASIISEEHASIRFRDDGCFLEDLESANGTQLDGTPITQTVRLGPLHVITFAGTFDFFFQMMEAEPMGDEDASASSPEQTSDADSGTRLDVEAFEPLPDLDEAAGVGAVEDSRVGGTRLDVEPLGPLPELEDEAAAPADSRDAAPVDEAGTRFDIEAFAPLPDLEEPAEAEGAPDELPRLRVSFSDGRTEVYALRPGANVIGRSLDCDIAISELSLSRQHARLTVIDTSESSFQHWKFEIEDLGSSNGTAVHGEVISGIASVGPGSEIVLGPEVQAKIEVP